MECGKLQMKGGWIIMALKEERNTRQVRRMKAIRENQGISLRDLATELGINYTTVSYWERGLRYPGKENQEKLAQFFDKTIDYLMEVDPHYEECGK